MNFQQNKTPFREIVKGNYGRKIAYADTEIVDESNILQIVADNIGIFNTNRVEARYLWRYKNGDQPILYRTKLVRDDINNKISENHAYEVVQYNVSQSYGEPLQYVSQSKDESVNAEVDKFNTYNKNAFKYQRNVQQGEWKSATGTSFLAVQRTKNINRPYRFVVPTPLNTFIIYSSITGEALLAVQELKDNEGKQYYLCFSDNKEFKVQNGKLIVYIWNDGTEHNYQLHAYGSIPIVEVPNNQDRLADIEIIMELLDAINIMQSNRMDGIEQFIQSWIKFVNCDVDEEEFKKMKMNGALVVKSNNGSDNKADVDIMTQELNQTQTQVAKDDLWNNALSILAIPNKQGNTGGDTQGAVELRNGWDFAKQRAKLKDAYIIEAEMRLAEVVLNILRVDGLGLNITINDFEVNIPHSPQDNMTVKANVYALLIQNGIHPLIAMKTCGLWNDAEKVYLLSKPYVDKLNEAINDEIANIPNSEEQIQKAKEIINNQQKQATT